MLHNHTLCTKIPGTSPVGLLKPGSWLNLMTLHLLLLQAGDLETNPGPSEVKYPCQVCAEEVTWECQALCCDECDGLIHADCIGISTGTYNELIGTSLLWFCKTCGVPNYTCSFANVHLSSFSMNNAFTNLSSDADSNFRDPNSTLESIASFNSPTKTSSPNKPHYQHKEKTKTRTHITILNVNCQSISAHKERFLNQVHSIKPDIIIGTESWLHEDIINPTFPH